MLFLDVVVYVLAFNTIAPRTAACCHVGITGTHLIISQATLSPVSGRLHSAFSVASLMYDKPSEIDGQLFQVGESHCRAAMRHAYATEALDV
jgi:hypothetical protein